MKISRLGSTASLFLVGLLGVSIPAVGHARGFSGAGFPQQPDTKQDAKPEVNPPAHPQAQDEKNPPARPEDAKPPEKDEHPANTKPEEKPKPAETNENRTTTTNNHKSQTTTKTNVHYTVKSKDVTVIKNHYKTELGHVDRANRPHIVVGGTITRENVTYIQPVPAEVIVGFPPVPPGFVWGYWDGYCFVYDPNTLQVIYVVDLL
jgi:cytoskeletal protein RodZ